MFDHFSILCMKMLTIIARKLYNDYTCLKWSVICLWNLLRLFNPFVPNAPILYPLKTSENRKVFQGVEKGCIGNKWVKIQYRWSDLTFEDSRNGYRCNISMQYLLQLRNIERRIGIKQRFIKSLKITFINTRLFYFPSGKHS